jgi:ubiquinone biosynthesis protein UbiJ
MRTLKIISLIMMFTISGMGVFAQQASEEVTDKELKQFASAFQQVQRVDQNAQQIMIKAVQDEGLEVQRFNEIQQAQQANQEVDASNEEIKKYESASTELKKIQVQAQQEMQEKITEEGLTVPRYQEIATSIQASPELQEKLQEYLKG